MLTFEDRWSMCRPSKIDVKLGCYTCSNIDTIYKLYANYTEGLHFSTFIVIEVNAVSGW